MYKLHIAMIINLLHHELLTMRFYAVDGKGHCLIHTSGSAMYYSLSYIKK